MRLNYDMLRSSPSVWFIPVLCLLAIGAPQTVRANTIVVKSVAELDLFNCTLRGAINNHNTRSQSSSLCAAGSGDDEILLEPPNGSPDIFIKRSLPATNGTLLIRTTLGKVTLHGAYFTVLPRASLTFSGPVWDSVGLVGEFAQDASLFDVREGATLEFAGNGTFSNHGGAALGEPPLFGGIVFSHNSIVKITGNPTFNDSQARQSGGVIYSEDNGSILFQNGTDRSLLAKNRASGRGGAIYIKNGTLQIASIDCDNNRAQDGACIFADHTRVDIASNAIMQFNRGEPAGAGRGGALAAQDSQVKITGGEWRDNSSGNGGTGGCCGVGAAIYVQRSPLSLDGTNCHDNAAKTGACIFADSAEVKLNNFTCTANAAFAGTCITTNSPLTIANSKLIGNKAGAGGKGGALWLVGSDTSVANSAIDNNSAGGAPFGTGDGRGGAIYVDSKSKLMLKASSCRGNTARNAGGCTYIEGGGAESFEDVNCDNNSAFDGGCAIVNPMSTLNIVKSKIRNNRATKVSRGGGLLVEATKVTITDSEISANSAGTFRDGGNGAGGGIFATAKSEIKLRRSSLANNDASGLGSDLELQDFSSVLAVNSTFANHGPFKEPGRSVHSVSSALDLASTTFWNAPLLAEKGSTSGTVRNSIFFNSAYCLGNLNGSNLFNTQFPKPLPGCSKGIPVVEVELDPNGLRNNGGLTPTVAELAGSKSIDSIPLLLCNNLDDKPLKFDQRALPRPDPGDKSGNCDTGAFEYQAH